MKDENWHEIGPVPVLFRGEMILPQVTPWNKFLWPEVAWPFQGIASLLGWQSLGENPW
jgi:hypothetical protein